VSFLLEFDSVRKYFEVVRVFALKNRPTVKAVDGVTFGIRTGTTFGLVGESGCGKSTIAKLAVRLLEPTDGTIRFAGREMLRGDRGQAIGLGREIGMIFQDAYASLNPRHKVRQILALPFKLHTDWPDREIEREGMRLLEAVGLSPAEQFLDRYAHELSGGQRQRVVIARAISLHPQLVVADEAVSSLDLSMRAQILKMMGELKANYNLTYLYITHDLGVVRSLCDEVAVMYLGKIVEMAFVDALYSSPLHPYTQLLLEATPIPNPRRARARSRRIMQGEVPSASNVPSGCRFHPRCPFAMPQCAEEPRLIRIGDHSVACHLHG